jgi:hypothetical protein
MSCFTPISYPLNLSQLFVIDNYIAMFYLALLLMSSVLLIVAW